MLYFEIVLLIRTEYAVLFNGQFNMELVPPIEKASLDVLAIYRRLLGSWSDFLCGHPFIYLLNRL